MCLEIRREEALMRITTAVFVAASPLAIGLVTPASAHQETAGKLAIGHPWVRATPAGTAGTYACIIEIKNNGEEPETLLGASVDGPSVTSKTTSNLRGRFAKPKGQSQVFAKQLL